MFKLDQCRAYLLKENKLKRPQGQAAVATAVAVAGVACASAINAAVVVGAAVVVVARDTA